MSNSFWNVDTDGIDGNSSGANNYGATGKTTAEMKTLSTFTDAGWDFEIETANGPDDYWDMDLSGIYNSGYPYLSWEDGGAVALPVELVSFTASAVSNNVILNWQTATEVNNYGFEIQRLKDSKIEKLNDWEKIGFVNGHGNSNSPKDYSFIDEKVSHVGKYCYRLKQIDTDGSFEYSDVVEVDFGQPNKFELMQNYPNPFNPSTKISFTVPQDSKVRLTLFNTLGQKIGVLIDGFKEAGFYNYQLSILNYQAEFISTNSKPEVLCK